MGSRPFYEGKTVYVAETRCTMARKQALDIVSKKGLTRPSEFQICAGVKELAGFDASLRTAIHPKLMSGQPAGQVAASFFGVTPAGYKAEHTAEQQRQAESGRKVELTPLQKKIRGQ